MEKVTTIAVSKLCCPVCWELLDVLGVTEIKPLGRHSTLSFHELPARLPGSVLNKLLNRLDVFLVAELRKMIDKFHTQRKPGSPTPSQETAYNASLHSYNEQNDFDPTGNRPMDIGAVTEAYKSPPRGLYRKFRRLLGI
jgi:hypothetical protein